jgi:hypothetical protein
MQARVHSGPNMLIPSRRVTTRGATKQGCPDSEEATYAYLDLRARTGIANAPSGANLAETPIRGVEGRADNDHEREIGEPDLNSLQQRSRRALLTPPTNHTTNSIEKRWYYFFVFLCMALAMSIGGAPAWATSTIFFARTLH